MSSTLRSTMRDLEPAQGRQLRWQSWPLVHSPQWSWLAIVGPPVIGSFIWLMGGGWLLAVFATVGLAVTLWQVLVPVTFELDSLGLRRIALGRTRLIAWQSIQAYQLRSTGAVLYRRAETSRLDLLRSTFIPYPSDADEVVAMLREHLPHANEIL